MKTTGWLPVGTKENIKNVIVSKGDVVQLCTGELVTFMEMKRVRFIAQMNGKRVSVPIYRNKFNNVPYIAKVTDKKDNSVIVKSAPLDKFKFGQLFALEGHKETFLFVENIIKRGAKKTIAIDLASNKRFTLGEGFTIVKINIPKVKKENIIIS